MNKCVLAILIGTGYVLVGVCIGWVNLCEVIFLWTFFVLAFLRYKTLRERLREQGVEESILDEVFGCGNRKRFL
jgi:hypothetical protein